MAYRLLLVSSIPVYKINDAYCTSDLWVRDLEKQVETVDQLTLVCPVNENNPKPQENTKLLPTNIIVFSENDLINTETYKKLVSSVDVVQIAANKPFWKSKVENRFLKISNKIDTYFVAALSSNRAKTVLINAKNKGILKVLKSWMLYLGINFSIWHFTKYAGGVFVVGQGLLKLINPTQSNTFVGTASWIRREDLISDDDLNKKSNNLQSRGKLKLCIATRLEYMKGIHIAIDALKSLHEENLGHTPDLLILGEGEELENLKNQTHRLGLDQYIEFGGTRSYPDSFFDTIRNYDLMLLTNLNDEQPRLVFDALSQGLIPICPDSLPFKSLKLEKEIYYERGNPTSLAEVIKSITEKNNYGPLMVKLIQRAHESTVDSMHENRAEWITQTLYQREKNGT